LLDNIFHIGMSYVPSWGYWGWDHPGSTMGITYGITNNYFGI
jgi:hypothetical protein